MCQIVLQGLVVVFVGVAVAATVGAGIVVAQAPAFHTEASGAIALMRRFLKVQAECLAEDFRGHATAGGDAEPLIALFGGAGLEPEAVILGAKDHYVFHLLWYIGFRTSNLPAQ